MDINVCSFVKLPYYCQCYSTEKKGNNTCCVKELLVLVTSTVLFFNAILSSITSLARVTRLSLGIYKIAGYLIGKFYDNNGSRKSTFGVSFAILQCLYKSIYTA